MGNTGLSTIKAVKGFGALYNVTFWKDDNIEVGRISWENGELEFKGEIAESAKVFFDFLKPYIDQYIEEQLVR